MVAPPASLLAEERTREIPETVIPGPASSGAQDALPHDLDYFKEMAKGQTQLKFGSKIGPVIEQEFDSLILPKIEETIEKELKPEELRNLIITEKPGTGRSEKIFHIYSGETGKDVIRFHVRTDRPPGDGYWFNFHYHLAGDSFEKHHELGRIYWDRNTPPAWTH
ncbi:hypothetical protein GKZ89_01575 [Bacillus mangrovi]|uniref:Cell division protein FtsK n=2 Tax=Metabacillus mangrovi TaxID=1491830 RepID=A0A7X2V3K0_9BACI|nr:YpjP family protein [Metabacillus mangrovi]MTH52078.1 hypothetical protein [Metabacillus mangrovi]